MIVSDREACFNRQRALRKRMLYAREMTRLEAAVHRCPVTGRQRAFYDDGLTLMCSIFLAAPGRLQHFVPPTKRLEVCCTGELRGRGGAWFCLVIGARILICTIKM